MDLAQNLNCLATRWSHTLVDQLRKSLAEAIAGKFRDGGAELAGEYLSEQIHALADGDERDQLMRFLCIVARLEWHCTHGGLSPADVNALAATGRAILRANGVVEGKDSRLGGLRGQLHLAMSQVRNRQGRHFESLWLSQAARGIGRRRPPVGHDRMALLTAVRALRRGHVRLAVTGFEAAETSGATLGLKLEARLGRINALRLRGELEQANALAATTPSEFPLDDEAVIALQWEKSCRQAQQSGDPAEIVMLARSRRVRLPTRLQLMALLWARVASSKAWMEALPLASTLRRRVDIARASPDAILYDCCLQLERCYDNAIPLNARIERLGRVLMRVERGPDVEVELLVWAAAARWLRRARQYMLAASAHEEYRALSLRLTSGVSTDALGCMSDVAQSDWFAYGEASVGQGIEPEAEHLEEAQRTITILASGGSAASALPTK